jgi:hypothetical protein
MRLDDDMPTEKWRKHLTVESSFHSILDRRFKDTPSSPYLHHSSDLALDV